MGTTEGDFRVKELEHKVRNREKEILRLQKCIECIFDGTQMTGST